MNLVPLWKESDADLSKRIARMRERRYASVFKRKMRRVTKKVKRG